MKSMRWRCAVAMTVMCVAWCPGLQAAAIDAEVERELKERAPNEEVSVIVSLSGKVNRRLFKEKDRSRRDNRLYRALREHGKETRASHKAFLQERGVRRMRELWASNSIAVTARADVIRELASRAGVERISPDSILQAPAVAYGSPAAPEWNLNAVSVPELWARGYTGVGIVVANMDTGVDLYHPDLVGRWRGGANSWFDPYSHSIVPYDPFGHGTQTMSIMVGGSAGGSAIGVAPGASWIAAKLYNDAGQARYSDIHLVFQWLLDPDGDPATLDAPDVVNASWGLSGSAGLCITEFSPDIDTLKTAGIAVTFAAGNDGPAPLTSLSPGNNPAGFATGAVDPQLTVASFSSRGQSACDGAIFPKLSAPGLDVSVADLSFGGMPLYTVVSGTSYAAPHTAGVMALLVGAFPNAGVGEIESALMQSAQDLGVAGGDNSYGYGLVNALAAYGKLDAITPHPPVITSTPVLAATQGTIYVYRAAASDKDGDVLTWSLDYAPAGMVINPATGRIAWRPTNARVGMQDVTARATDPGGLFATQSFSIAVANVNDAPVTRNNVYTMIKGGMLTVAAPGVLTNDSDPDVGDTLAAANFGAPLNGTLAGNADGGFTYTPPPAYTGAATFTYRAQDNHGLAGNSATVYIRVRNNWAPIASDDALVAHVNSPLVIDVLANDSDPDSAIDPANRIDPATVFIPANGRPNKGGAARVNADGTIAYTPRRGFRGTETFMYRVRDTYSTPAASKAAYVRVNVQ